MMEYLLSMHISLDLISNTILKKKKKNGHQPLVEWVEEEHVVGDKPSS